MRLRHHLNWESKGLHAADESVGHAGLVAAGAIVRTQILVGLAPPEQAAGRCQYRRGRRDDGLCERGRVNALDGPSESANEPGCYDESPVVVEDLPRAGILATVAQRLAPAGKRACGGGRSGTACGLGRRRSADAYVGKNLVTVGRDYGLAKAYKNLLPGRTYVDVVYKAGGNSAPAVPMPTERLCSVTLVRFFATSDCWATATVWSTPSWASAMVPSPPPPSVPCAPAWIGTSCAPCPTPTWNCASTRRLCRPARLIQSPTGPTSTWNSQRAPA